MMFPDRVQGAQPQQDAHGADHARHDHRRRRRHHDGRARHRRADVDRSADPVGRHQHDHRVSAGNFTQGGVRQGQGNASTLTPDDAVAITRRARRAVRRRRIQHARPDRRRQSELGHAGAGHRRGPAAHPLVAGERRRASSRRRTSRPPRRSPCSAASCAISSSARRRSDRPDHPHQATSRSPSSA